MLAKDPIPLSKIPHLCHMQKSIGLVTELWSPRFVTEYWNVFFFPFAMSTIKKCRDRAFSNSGLEVGPAFQLPMFAKCDAVPNKICGTCLFLGIPSRISFGNSTHPLPARSFRFLRATAHSSSSALCLHYACKRSHPFVEDSGFVSYAEKHKFGHGLVVSKVCYGILECVFFPICHVDYRNVSGLSF